MTAFDPIADVGRAIYIKPMNEKRWDDRLRKLAKVKPEPEKPA